MNENYYSFSALSGIQGRKSNYLIQVPLKVLSKFLKEENTNLPADQRSQRVLNKVRVAQIVKYIVDNPDSYILPPLVAYVSAGEVHFEKFDNTTNFGCLKISLTTDVHLFDGQHRRAAIEQAVQLRQFLGEETIAIMLYSNASIEAAQQVFADININATKPAQSIKLLYNHRDNFNNLTRKVIESVPLFKEYVDYERTNLSTKSKLFFTFSGIYQITKTLYRDQSDNVDLEHICSYWRAVSLSIPQWQALENNQIQPEVLRQQYVHAHSVVWSALAIVGQHLLKEYPTDWMQYVEKLKQINWTRDDSQWQGRCVINGRIAKSGPNIILTSNMIFQIIGISLPVENQLAENTFNSYSE